MKLSDLDLDTAYAVNVRGRPCRAAALGRVSS